MRDAKMEHHRIAAELENATFLMDVVGLSMEATARRLGLTVEVLKKRIGRETHGKRDTNTQASTGEGS